MLVINQNLNFLYHYYFIVLLITIVVIIIIFIVNSNNNIIIMPGLHTPKYPVVDPDPSIGKAIGNFNLTDYRNIIAFTGSGFVTGFFIGINIHYIISLSLIISSYSLHTSIYS